MRLKAGVLHLFELQDGARPCSNSKPRAGQPGGALGEQGWGLLGTRWPPWRGQGWGGCTVPICPRLEVVGSPSAGRGHMGKGCTSWLPLLMAGSWVCISVGRPPPCPLNSILVSGYPVLVTCWCCRGQVLINVARLHYPVSERARTPSSAWTSSGF